jgi:hypothetical protein
VRAKVIAFQRKYDLLDRNIFWLRRAGHLQIARTELTVDTGLLTPVLGWVQMVFMGLLLIAMFLHIYISNAPEWKQIIGFVSVGVIWLGIFAAIVKMFIEPRRILKQCGAITAEHRAKPDTPTGAGR